MRAARLAAGGCGLAARCRRGPAAAACSAALRRCWLRLLLLGPPPDRSTSPLSCCSRRRLTCGCCCAPPGRRAPCLQVKGVEEAPPDEHENIGLREFAEMEKHLSS